MTALEAVLAEQAALAAEHDGSPAARSVVPGLTIRCSTEPTAPIPALFEPVFYVVLQGSKRLTFAGRTHDFATGTCAVATVGLPFVSQVIRSDEAARVLHRSGRPRTGSAATLTSRSASGVWPLTWA